MSFSVLRSYKSAFVLLLLLSILLAILSVQA